MTERESSVDSWKTLHQIVAAAERDLSPEAWNYLAGASETETSARRNRLALDALAFRPRVLCDVSSIDTTGKLLGHSLRLPVVLAPIGSSQLFHPGGGSAAAAGASDFGTLSFVSSHSEPDFEEVAGSADGPKVFQLYLLGPEEWMNERIERAIAAGYCGFCLTVDTPVLSRRERDWLTNWSIPSGTEAGDFGYQARMTWDLVERYKTRFDLPLVLKGIATAEDARRACDLGVDVVYVSNHGGRQLDHALGGAEMLPEIVEAVAGRAEVVVDGGVLRGSDVVKLLALGADAVGCGRLYCFGLAAAGAAGVLRTLEILRFEVKTTLALLGVSSPGQLNASHLTHAALAPVRGAEPHISRAFPFLEFSRTRFD